MDRLTRLQANVGIALLLIAGSLLAVKPWLAGAAAAALLAAALDLPPSGALAALWLGLARLLGRLVRPAALLLLYFAFFVPYAWCFRLLNRRAVDRHFGRVDGSLWDERPEGGRGTDFRQPW